MAYALAAKMPFLKESSMSIVKLAFVLPIAGGIRGMMTPEYSGTDNEMSYKKGMGIGAGVGAGLGAIIGAANPRVGPAAGALAGMIGGAIGGSINGALTVGATRLGRHIASSDAQKRKPYRD